MELLPIFILLALITGAAGLGAFFWSVKAGQFDDMEGPSARLFLKDSNDKNLSG